MTVFNVLVKSVNVVWRRIMGIEKVGRATKNAKELRGMVQENGKIYSKR